MRKALRDFELWIYLCSILFTTFALSLYACGSAPTAPLDVRAVEVQGPVGVTCYAIVQASTAVGGNCLRVQ
jgi:hypothetical protein